MYRVSPRFIEELRKPIHNIRVKMEILTNPGMDIIEGGEIYGTSQTDRPGNHLVDGVVDVNTDRLTRRTFSATLLNEDGLFAPGEDWGGMFYVNRIVRLFRGIQLGDTADTVEWVKLGTFLLDNVDIIVERNLSTCVMSGSDFWKKFAKGELPENHKYDAGTHVNTIIREIAAKCGVTDLNLDPLTSRSREDKVLQKDRNFDNQSKYGEMLEKISDMFAIDLYFDTSGALVSDDTLSPADKAPVWTFESGDSLITVLRSAFNDDMLFNGVKVIGTGHKKDIIVSTVYDHDPDSKSNIKRIGRRTYRRETEDVSTQSQGDRLAKKLFNRKCGRIRNELSIESVCIPFFEGEDVVRVREGNFSNTNAKARLIQFTVPLTGSRQSLRARRVVRLDEPTPVINGPVISNVGTNSIDTISGNVTWDLSEASDGLVEYGVTNAYGSSSALVAAYQTSHVIRLVSLQPDTLYHFRVRSTNQVGGTSVSGDYTFTTDALPTGPTISGVGTSAITSTTVTVGWSLSEFATGQVQYGTSTGYGQWSVYESSFNYDYHSIILTGLQPSTLYHYRVHSTDPDGNASVSGDYTFQTAAAGSGGGTVGSVYGSGMAMDTKSNLILPLNTYAVAVSFVAPASGTVDAIRWQRRTGNAQLYSGGNGGTAAISIETADANGKPTGTQVGSTITYPMPGVPDAGYLIRNAFTGTKPNLTSGARYVVVFRNSHASPSSNWFSINCNLLWDGNEAPSPHGLVPANPDHKVWQGTSGGAWSYDTRHWCGIDVEMTGGQHAGMAYHNTMLGVASRQYISGSLRVRQRLTVSGGDKAVKSLWVFVGRQSGTSNLTIQVLNSAGTVLRTLTVPYSAVEYWNPAQVGWDSKGSWVGGNFITGDLTLVNGQTYSIVLSTPVGTQYTCIGTHHTQDGSTDVSGDPNATTLQSWQFDDGLDYEYSTNGGGAWSLVYDYTPGHAPFFFELSGATPPPPPPPPGADYQQLVLDLAPIGYWPLQEASGNAADATGNGWTATAQGASITYGVTGPTINGETFNAVTLPGSSAGYFTIPDTMTDPATTGFTISAWIHCPTGAAFRPIFWWSQTGEGTFWLRKTNADAGQVVTVDSAGAAHGAADASGIPNDSWVWVAGRYDPGAGILRAYCGTATADDTSFTGTWKRDGNPTCQVGAGGGDYFDGELAHIAYWNAPLTDDQMTGLRTGVLGGGGPPPTGYQDLVLALSPTAFWPMQEASGNIVDTTGHGWTASPGGSPTYGVAGPTIDGEAFDAITLNGTDARFNVPYTMTDPGTSGFTISAWVKCPQGAAYRPIFWFLQTGEGTLYLRKTSEDGIQGVTLDAASAAHGNAYTATSSLPNDTWAWVAVRYDSVGGVLRAYVNTTTADDTSFVGTWKRDGDPNCFIGSGGGEWFDGEITLVAYWNTPLTDAQMTSLRTGV
jgi:hypothetical protein